MSTDPMLELKTGGGCSFRDRVPKTPLNSGVFCQDSQQK
jgi:hypothetical protein